MSRSTPSQSYGNTGPIQAIPDQSQLSPTTNEKGEQLGSNGSLRRRGSFSFLRRSKSRDRAASSGSAPQRKLSKKDSKRMREEQMRKMSDQIPQRPPRIPAVPSQPEIQTFGGEDVRPDSSAVMSSRAAGSYPQRLAHKASQENVGSDYYRGMPIPPVPPMPPIPGATATPAGVESMANRARYSYASSAISTINSPRKIRRRRNPTPYNILVIGSRNSGKTSFLNFLQSTLALPMGKRRQSARDEFDDPRTASEGAFPNFASRFVETEVVGERIGVTLWDSEGLEKNMVDLQLKEFVNFIESKFEDTYTEERKVARAPGFRDTHIHCVFMLLDPVRLDANIAAEQKANMVSGAKANANSFVKARPEPIPGGLDGELDLSILRALKGKTEVVPIISKADTITAAHMKHLKRAVWESLKQNGFDTLEAPEKEDDDGDDSDASTEQGGRRHDLDERDEDTTAGANGNAKHSNEPDKFSMTSHLDSPSSDSSSFTSADFDLAKPGKASRRRSSSAEMAIRPVQHLLPFSIISPDPYEAGATGRRFPWGLATPLNAEHCDFLKLKEMIFSEWRGDLREASRELWYEGWRTSRLNRKSKGNAVSLGVNDVPAKVRTSPKQQKGMQSNLPWVQ